MLNNEIWKDIDNLPYEISSTGIVRRKADSAYYHSKKAEVKPYINNKGYLCINLYKQSKVYKFQIHRLLAIAFLPNPEGWPVINHIDGNPLNNDLSNLEWCTERENAIHGTRTKRVAEKLSQKVIQLDLNDNILNVFKSMRQAERETGIDATSISACCNGKRKSAGGYKWRRKWAYLKN